MGLVIWAAGAVVAAPPTGGPPPASLSASLDRVQNLLDEIKVHRALIGSTLTPRQLASLQKVVEQSADALRAQQAKNDQAEAAYAGALAQIRARLAAGQNVNRDTETRYRQAVAAGQAKLRALRDKWRDQLKTELISLATPKQKLAILSTTTALARLERQTRWQTAGDPQEGPAGILGEQLDELREVLPADFPDQARRFARLFVRRPPLPNLNKLSPEERASLQKQGGLRVVYRRKMDAVMQPYLQLADRVRRLTPNQYAGQRLALSTALLDAMLQSRSHRNEESDDARLTQFVERYLLNPRAPVVFRERLGR